MTGLGCEVMEGGGMGGGWEWAEPVLASKMLTIFPCEWGTMPFPNVKGLASSHVPSWRIPVSH